jgi:hypothetical protein
MFYSSLILNITFFKKKKKRESKSQREISLRRCVELVIKQVFKLIGYEMDLTGWVQEYWFVQDYTIAILTRHSPMRKPTLVLVDWLVPELTWPGKNIYLRASEVFQGDPREGFLVWRWAQIVFICSAEFFLFGHLAIVHHRWPQALSVHQLETKIKTG